jgi:hypothetical protein
MCRFLTELNKNRTSIKQDSPRIGENPQNLLELKRTDKIAKMLDMSNDHQENKNNSVYSGLKSLIPELHTGDPPRLQVRLDNFRKVFLAL